MHWADFGQCGRTWYDYIYLLHAVSCFSARFGKSLECFWLRMGVPQKRRFGQPPNGIYNRARAILDSRFQLRLKMAS